MLLPTLRELDEVYRYDTDKLGRGDSPHDYCDAYEFHFSQFRELEFNFWEIGIGRGDSLRMWHDYFPKATVVGIDNDEIPERLRDYSRIVPVAGDVNDEKLLKSLAKKYPPGIVLDDGSHKTCDVIAAFNALYEFTRFVYCVEDLGTQYESKHGREFLEDFEDAEFPNVVYRHCGRLARNENGGRVCWEPGQVYIYPRAESQ